VKRARRGDGPTLLEYQTYRWLGHHLGDDGKYRPPEEVDYWKKERDPIKNFGQKLLEEKILTQGGIETNHKEVVDEIESAVQFAHESEPADVERILEDVCYNPSVERCDKQGSPTMREIMYREAIQEALREEMLRDQSVFLIGEDIGLICVLEPSLGRVKRQSHCAQARPKRAVSSCASATPDWLPEQLTVLKKATSLALEALTATASQSNNSEEATCCLLQAVSDWRPCVR